MPYHAEVLLDSITPTGQRLTTFVLRFPRFVLSGGWSRNLSRSQSPS